MQDRLAVVTGGTKGIGVSLSRRLLATGHRVVALYRGDQESADLAAKELGGGFTVLRADVADPDGVARVTKLDTHGTPSVLVNNAGAGRGARCLHRPLAAQRAGPRVPAVPRRPVLRDPSRHFPRTGPDLPGLPRGGGGPPRPPGARLHPGAPRAGARGRGPQRGRQRHHGGVPQVAREPAEAGQDAPQRDRDGPGHAELLPRVLPQRGHDPLRPLAQAQRADPPGRRGRRVHEAEDGEPDPTADERPAAEPPHRGHGDPTGPAHLHAEVLHGAGADPIPHPRPRPGPRDRVAQPDLRGRGQCLVPRGHHPPDRP